MLFCDLPMLLCVRVPTLPARHWPSLPQLRVEVLSLTAAALQGTCKAAIATCNSKKEEMVSGGTQRYIIVGHTGCVLGLVYIVITSLAIFTSRASPWR